MGAAMLDPACPELLRLKTLHRDQSLLLSGPSLAEAVRRRQQEDLRRHGEECARCAGYVPPPEAKPVPAARGGRFAGLRAFFLGRRAEPKAQASAPEPAPRPAPAKASKPAAPKAPAPKAARPSAAPKPAATAKPTAAPRPPRPASKAAPPPRASSSGATRRKDPVAAALQLFGLPPGADAESVRVAYRERALLCHPDKVMHLEPSLRTSADAAMKEVNRAYEILKRAGRA